ncbi:LytTR family transcriptional regulator [Paenibacillus sp. MWE-103]|uniref:LytTR family transcriptional regulator n=1 Tax=Paenibacillus artemisiicola TaxID=1172618 RepID=A0ABS3WA39_9BACL|nr:MULTISPECIES: LytTR family transcriptional regulator DNA-binding domain-containing protein [Paenibacillus]MBO7745201.1 LytTR family transcriptional regulator [Paenibacillus artemisiicola]SFI91090.1 LytTr DNA-binding domain-containing protein [Paenibacillus sp. UNC496MF]
MLIPLVKRYNKKDFDIVYVHRNDVLLMHSNYGQINYQHKDGTILNPLSTFEEHERFLTQDKFARVDRCYVVNMDRVEFFDEERQRVFFDPEPVGKTAPSAPVSFSRMDTVKDVRRGSANGSSVQNGNAQFSR